MKNTPYLLGLCLLFLFSCNKELNPPTGSEVISSIDSSNLFLQYTIQKGQQYCDKNYFVPVQLSQLKFKVKFDSSAIYISADLANQFDINKLYGFSDNNSDHHQFSARFGWRWSNDSLRLFGYTYNNGIRDYKELATVMISSINDCSIKVEPNNYVFSLNNKIDSLPRKSATAQAIGYKLYPYFGGDETAPHEINIWINEED